jgi:hypothetical protein
MPERQGLLDLARTYLEVQARLWPDLVGTTAVPAADAATIAAMADDFERRFRQLHADVFRPGDTPIAWIALAVAYLRFSDENSNPRSLDQQLLNVLNRAWRDGVFVPWHYVLADAAVSGTLACRTGYTLAKTIVERRDEFGVTWFLIDDLSRLSRNTIESLRLGELTEATGVRVVGASDGYDSANPQSSLLLPVLGSMNEAFITRPNGSGGTCRTCGYCQTNWQRPSSGSSASAPSPSAGRRRSVPRSGARSTQARPTSRPPRAGLPRPLFH